MSKILIICPGSKSGTIYGVSEILCNSFNEVNMNCTIKCLKDLSEVKASYFGLLFYFLKLDKNTNILLMHFESILLTPILKLFGFKKIYPVFHTDLVGYYDGVNKVRRAVIRFLLLITRNLTNIFVSIESMDKSKKFFKIKKCEYVYNIVENNKTSIRIKKRNKCHKVIIGVVSRLHPKKNISRAVRIFSEIGKIENVELHIYGEGEERSSLENLIKLLNSSDIIKLKGFFSDIDNIYSNIDGLISFSELEGFGVAIVESIVRGVPVLHTNCGSGPSEIICGEFVQLESVDCIRTDIGYLVKNYPNQAKNSKDMTHFDKKYISIVNNFIKEIRYSGFSMEYDYTKFSKVAIIAKWEKIFLEVR